MRDPAKGTYIVRTPGVLGGMPRIAGTRIAVSSIKGLHASGFSRADIGRLYPQLSTQQIRAALRFVGTRDRSSRKGGGG